MSNKFTKLRRPWLTIDEAAASLSATFDEHVGTGDVLRLVLDGELQVSAYFPTPAPFRKLREIANHTADNLMWCLQQSEKLAWIVEKGQADDKARKDILDDRSKRLHDGCQIVDGVYAFPLEWLQRNLVLRAWHESKGDPVDVECYSVCVLINDEPWQLQDRASLLEMKPARDLQPQGRFVVRMEELLRFQHEQSPAARPTKDDARSVATLLKLVNALEAESPNKGRGMAGRLVGSMAARGIEAPDEDTVQKWLREARRLG